MEASTRYLGVMHGFRIVTEAGTRDGLRGSLIGGYFKALSAMHGWSDGDGYFENYLGHPIQGAASSYIWINNDPRYSHAQFGKNPDYWKSRLRAYAFSWAFSEQFEIGPISEASIGQIQRYCCQYGFVDHVITPNLGLAVMVGEDFIDKGVVRRIEDRTSNVGIRIASRIVLNPMQSFANMMSWRYPWHRENRDAPSFYDGQLHEPLMRPEMQIGKFEPLIVPTLEIAAHRSFRNANRWTVLPGRWCRCRRAPDRSVAMEPGSEWMHVGTEFAKELERRFADFHYRPTMDPAHPQSLDPPCPFSSRRSKSYKTVGGT